MKCGFQGIPMGSDPRTTAAIEQYGQMVLGIMDDPSFAYTVGNAEKGLPELLLIGNFDPKMVTIILNILGEKMRAANKPLEGDVSVGGQFPVRIRPVRKLEWVWENYTIQAGQRLRHLGEIDIYGVLQCLFCDKNGVYPDEQECANTFLVPLV